MSYGTIAGLRGCLPTTALGTLSPADQQAALDRADATLNTYFNGRYALPLSAWDGEVSRRAEHLAAYDLMAARGYSPAAGADDIYRLRYDDAIRWAEGVQAKRVHPIVTPAADQTPTYTMPLVISSSVTSQAGTVGSSRGW